MTEQDIVQQVVKSFRTFGKGSAPTLDNPIAIALAEREPTFAAGVDVAEVVRFVMQRCDR